MPTSKDTFAMAKWVKEIEQGKRFRNTLLRALADPTGDADDNA